MNGNTFTHELFKVGDLVTFQCGDTLKEGVVLICGCSWHI